MTFPEDPILARTAAALAKADADPATITARLRLVEAGGVPDGPPLLLGAHVRHRAAYEAALDAARDRHPSSAGTVTQLNPRGAPQRVLDAERAVWLDPGPDYGDDIG